MNEKNQKNPKSYDKDADVTQEVKVVKDASVAETNTNEPSSKLVEKNSQFAIILARSLIIRLTAVATLPHYESVQQGKQIQLKKNLTAAQRSVISLQFEGQIQ